MNIEKLKLAAMIERKMHKKIMFNPKTKKFRNYLTNQESDRVKEVIKRITKIDNFGNEHKTKIEINEFINDPPNRYTCYLSKRKSGKYAITTWTGKHLAFVRISKIYKDNFGGQRISFNSYKSINGLKYYGTGFCGFGGYANITAYKNS